MKNKVFNFILLIVGLYLVVSLSRSILALIDKGRIVENAEKKVERLSKENSRLNIELKTVQKKEYIEKQAREKLNMSKPQETVVVVPEALLSEDLEASFSVFFNTPKYVPNWQKWWRVFMSR